MFDGALFPYGYQPEASLPDDAIEAATLTRPVLVDAGSPRAAVVLVTLTARAPGGLGNSAPVPLIAADALDGDVAVTRAHTPSSATVLMQSADAGWEEVAQNLPRFAWPARALRVDVANTNGIRNPRFEGGTVGDIGSGGALPTNLSIVTAGGLTTTFLGVFDEGGVPMAHFRFAGTASGTQYILQLETASAIAASPSQDWAANWIARVVDATAPPLAHSTRIGGRNGAGASVSPVNAAFVPGATLARFSRTATLSSNAFVVAMTLDYRFTMTNGASYDHTIALGAPNVAPGTDLTLPSLLPVAATPAATARAIDVPIWTPSEFPRRGCVVLRATLDAAAGASALGLMQIDDGTDANRIVARVAAGGLLAEALVVSGSTTVATLTQTASLTAGVEFRAIVAWSPGGVRFGTTAGGLTSATVAISPNLARALFGHANAAGTLPMSGAVLADFYPFWPSEAEASALLVS